MCTQLPRAWLSCRKAWLVRSSYIAASRLYGQRADAGCGIAYSRVRGSQFSEGKVAPPGAKIVYIDGAFDLFHPGHVEILQVGLPYLFLTRTSTLLNQSHA